MDEIKDENPEDQKSELVRLWGHVKVICSQKDSASQSLNKALSREKLDKKELYGVLATLNNIPTYESLREKLKTISHSEIVK